MHKTRAGVSWINNFVAVPAKILVGTEAIKWYDKDPSDWFGAPNCSRLEQVVGDRMPEAFDYLKKAYDGDSPIGSWFAHRGSFCVHQSKYAHGKDELKRFKSQVFRNTWDAVVLGNETLSILRLQELQEDRILMDNPDLIGLYIRWNVDQPDYVYVGISEDVANRSHTNAANYLWNTFSVPRIDDARRIERKVHEHLEREGEAVHSRGKGHYRVKGHDARQLVLDFIMKHYDTFFHGIGGNL